VAARHDAPPDRFWAVVRDYLACFDEMPNAATLWLEYWIDSVRRGRPSAIDRTVEPILSLLETLLDGLRLAEPAAAAAHALLSYLLGTIVQQRVHHLPFAVLQTEVAALLRLPPPLAQQTGAT
jgi:AcrR family transcriptional regulator